MQNICANCKHWQCKDRDRDAYAPCGIGVGRTSFNDGCKAFEAHIRVIKPDNPYKPIMGYHPNTSKPVNPNNDSVSREDLTGIYNIQDYWPQHDDWGEED